jgi:prepilin-type N-terminal cleavage/methylation domain-containing protein/prepilin-type processing-associated H-X9-DG protein
MSRRCCRGFTLVEVLVVIAIIGLIIALIFPALSAATESSRRAQCAYNLSRLMIAMQSYQQANELYPSGTIAASGPVRNEPQGLDQSWTIWLLPHLDEGNVFRAIDQKVSVYDNANRAARERPMPPLLCPSDYRNAGDIYGSNYAACQNDVEAPINTDNRGMFFLNSKLRPNDLTDGAAYTLFLSEKLIRPGDLGWISGTRATLRNTGTPLNKFLPVGEADSENIAAMAPKGTDPLLYVGGFESLHPGGVNMAMGDGSVQFVSDLVDQKVLEQWGDRADGQMTALPASL